MLQNTHFPQENDQCRMGPDKPGEIEGILALPSRDREFSAYFQLLWDWGSKETPGRKQPPLPIHSWSKLNLSGMRGHKRNKNKTGLQGAEITTHASPGTWTFQIAQKGIFFSKQLSSLMPFFGFFWQTIPSSASSCPYLSTACLLGNAVAGSLSEPEKAIYRSWEIGIHFPQASKNTGQN